MFFLSCSCHFMNDVCVVRWLLHTCVIVRTFVWEIVKGDGSGAVGVVTVW